MLYLKAETMSKNNLSKWVGQRKKKKKKENPTKRTKTSGCVDIQNLNFWQTTTFYPEVSVPLDILCYFKGQCFNHNNRNKYLVSKTRVQIWNQTWGSVCLLPHTDHWYCQTGNTPLPLQLNEWLFFLNPKLWKSMWHVLYTVFQLKTFCAPPFFTPKPAKSLRILHKDKVCDRKITKRLRSELGERPALLN